MPVYKYKCAESHEMELSHPIAELSIVRRCPRCGTKMHRVPQAVSVNWNGLPPHLESTRPPVLKNFIDGASERREKYLEKRKK